MGNEETQNDTVDQAHTRAVGVRVRAVVALKPSRSTKAKFKKSTVGTACMQHASANVAISRLYSQGSSCLAAVESILSSHVAISYMIHGHT